ncbi:MAG TPA: hypothetical protein VK543_07670 [Puia sp.]|nr:hypothetical protein [Puia sp.]
MISDPNQSAFSKAMLAGLFAGVIATLACFIFDIAYRCGTGYTPSEFINVSSIIFIVNLLLLVAGIIYFVFIRSFRSGQLIFSVIFALLTAFCIWKAESFRRFADDKLSHEFSHLLSGTLLIIGIAVVLIPVIHSNKKLNNSVI